MTTGGIDKVTNGNDRAPALTTEPCDGVHPDTGERCVLGRHKGYHQSADGTRWLDD